MAILMTGTRPDDIPGTDLELRVVNMAELAYRRRDFARGLAFKDLDVHDPLGGPRSGYQRAARRILAAVSAIVAVL
jgi:hypothetical protein